MEHYQATIEYDGSGFYGFQVQPGRRTVQGLLEARLAALQGGAPCRVRGAGRTDRGVHATGQVIDFHLRWGADLPALARALDATLPADVALRALQPAPEGFHPRFDALSRGYVYTLLVSERRRPLRRHTTHRVAPPLDVEAMTAALAPLVGEHDFASYGNAPDGVGSTVRHLLIGRVTRDGERVRVALEANGFLNRMVRRMVSALLLVGRGREEPTYMERLLAARDLAQAPPPAPAAGLCLVGVRYPSSRSSSGAAPDRQGEGQ